VPNSIAKYHMCIVKKMKLDSNIISRASEMKLIMQFGVGLEGNCNFCYSPHLTYSFMFILII
jgi:phosphoglycerate dehydrogenase-like enzyme